MTVGPGSHVLAVQGTNGARQTFGQTINITVNGASGGGTCQPLSTVPSEHICTPVNNGTVSSPFALQSAAKMANAVKYSQVWIDGVKKYEVASASINTSLTAGAGTHHFTLQTMDSANVIAKQTLSITVSGSTPPPFTCTFEYRRSIGDDLRPDAECDVEVSCDNHSEDARFCGNRGEHVYLGGWGEEMDWQWWICEYALNFDNRPT